MSMATQPFDRDQKEKSPNMEDVYTKITERTRK